MHMLAVLLLLLLLLCRAADASPNPKIPAADAPADGRLALACSLSGTLDAATGSCSCLEGWRGPVCSTLDLLPISSSTALAEITAWAPAGRNSWGGSVVRDPAAATPKKPYHMFAAVMEGDRS
eukprot:SAG22_NODE_10965_length_507_cov_1.127451_1_plen_122_part_01